MPARPSWNSIRKQLKALEPDALIALVKDLYEVSTDNREFVNARLAAGSAGAALGPYRKRVVAAFNLEWGKETLKLGEARNAIREYHKATGDAAGTIELLLAYSEAGARLTNDLGDIDSRFYNSLCSAFDELADRVRKEGVAAWRNVAARLETLVDLTSGIGWGYHDHLADVFQELEDHFSGR